MRNCCNFLVSLFVIHAIKDSATKYLLVDIEATEKVETERFTTENLKKCMICEWITGTNRPNGKCRDENDLGTKRECPYESYNTCFKLVRPCSSKPGCKEILRGCKFDKISGSVCYPENEDEEKLCLCSGDYCNGSEIDNLEPINLASGLSKPRAWFKKFNKKKQ